AQRVGRPAGADHPLGMRCTARCSAAMPAAGFRLAGGRAMTTTEGETSAPPAADPLDPATEGPELPQPADGATSLRRPPLRMAAPAIAAAAGLALAIAGRRARGRRDAGDGG